MGGVATEDWGLRARVQTEGMEAEDMQLSRGYSSRGVQCQGSTAPVGAPDSRGTWFQRAQGRGGLAPEST